MGAWCRINHVPEIGADFVLAAVLHRVTGRTLLKDLFAGGDIGRGQQGADGFGPLRLFGDARDRRAITHLDLKGILRQGRLME